MRFETDYGSINISNLPTAEGAAQLFNWAVLWRGQRKLLPEGVYLERGRPERPTGQAACLPPLARLPQHSRFYFNQRGRAGEYLGNASMMAFLGRSSFWEMEMWLKAEAEKQQAAGSSAALPSPAAARPPKTPGTGRRLGRKRRQRLQQGLVGGGRCRSHQHLGRGGGGSGGSCACSGLRRGSRGRGPQLRAATTRQLQHDDPARASG